MLTLPFLAASLAQAGPNTQQYGSPYELYMSGVEAPQTTKPSKATASSSLTEGKLTHSPSRVSDGNKGTAWCEGKEGTGAGSSLTLEWDQPIELYAIEFWGGYFIDERRLFSNERVKSYKVLLDGKVVQEHTTADIEKDTAAAHMSSDFGNVMFFGASELDTENLPSVSAVTFEVVSVHPGEKYTDLCISEIVVYLAPKAMK